MIWPVNGPITGAFGEQRPGHIHAGIDIAAGEGTPIHAADNGRVVLMQGTGASGGYGNYTCVQHQPRCRRATRTSRASARAWGRASARAR